MAMAVSSPARAKRPAPPTRLAAPLPSQGASSSNRLRPDADRLEFSAPHQRVDGAAFCRRALADIRARVAAGETVRVVFDVDDTLADTRYRTLFVARLFDRVHRTRHFSELTVTRVDRDGERTARGLGLPEEVVAAFAIFWRAHFWDGQNFAHDRPIQRMIDLAHAARAAGAEVLYLTGRIEAYRAYTRAELARLGLPQVDDAHLVLKPQVGLPTPAYKQAELERLRLAGEHLAWFLTEGRRDLAHLQRHLPGVPTVLLESALERGGEPLRADTPTFGAATRSRLV
jgi:hypothetical protein